MPYAGGPAKAAFIEECLVDMIKGFFGKENTKESWEQARKAISKQIDKMDGSVYGQKRFGGARHSNDHTTLKKRT